MSTLHITTPDQPMDPARIEAEARRLRAEALRDGLRWLGSRIASVWSSPEAKAANTV